MERLNWVSGAGERAPHGPVLAVINDKAERLAIDAEQLRTHDKWHTILHRLDARLQGCSQRHLIDRVPHFRDINIARRAHP